MPGVLIIRSNVVAWDGLREEIHCERRGEIEIIAESTSLDDAASLNLSSKPALVLVAIPLPGTTLPATLSTLRRQFPQARLIAIVDDPSSLADDAARSLLAAQFDGALLWNDVKLSTVHECLATALAGIKVISENFLVPRSSDAGEASGEARTGAPIRTLIADPNPVARAGLIALLSRDSRFDVAGETAFDALSAARRLVPELVVLEPSQHGHFDLESVRELTQTMPQARICIYTVAFDRTVFMQVMAAGVGAYLLKGSDDHEALLDALALTGRCGTVVTGRAVSERFSVDGDITPIALFEPSKWLESLTPRERQVLESVASGLTDEATARRLGTSYRTITYHISNLLAKSGAETRVRLGVLAQRAGISGEQEGSLAAEHREQ